jgi:natural product precursor
MEKLNFEKFEKSVLPQNQLRSITGGGTTWTGAGGPGTDTIASDGHTTTFSDQSTSTKDGKLSLAPEGPSGGGLGG